MADVRFSIVLVPYSLLLYHGQSTLFRGDLAVCPLKDMIQEMPAISCP